MTLVSNNSLITVPNNSPSELQIIFNNNSRFFCETHNVFVLNSKNWCTLCSYNGVLRVNCNTLRLALKVANYWLDQERWLNIKNQLIEKNSPYEAILMTYRNFCSSKSHLIGISTLQLLSAKILILRTNYIYLNKHKHELFIVENFLFTELREKILKSCFEDFLNLFPLPKLILNTIKKSLFYEWLVHELKKLILVNNDVCFVRLTEALTLFLLSKKSDKKNVIAYDNIFK